MNSYRVYVNEMKADGRENEIVDVRKYFEMKRVEKRSNLMAKVTMLSLIICISLGTLFLLIDTFNFVEASSTDYKKGITSVQVDNGDTLWSIASEMIDEYDMGEYYSVKSLVNEITEINDIYKDDIQAGNYIVVPYIIWE